MTHTKDALAEALRAVGLDRMAGRAAEGYYHDFLSPLATPAVQLANDLANAAKNTRHKDNWDAIVALRQRVIDGDFDATKEEADDWANSAEGRETFGKLRR